MLDNTKSSDEKIETLVGEFTSIIAHDYSGEYVKFNESTPIMLLDFFDQLKINSDVKVFFSILPSFFNSAIHNVIEYYND